MERDIIDDINNFRNACVMDVDLKEYHDGRIEPLAVRIARLEGSRGMDGREVEMKEGKFPEGVEGEDAILWRLKPRNESDPQAWNCLAFKRELKGDTGATGANGHDGRGVEIHGVVEHQNDLTLPSTYENLGITIPVIGTMMMVHGVNEAHIYKGTGGDTGWQHIVNWANLGKMNGIKGEKGDRGERGEKGDSGGIGAFLMQYIINQATSAAINSVMMEVNTAVNDAVNDAIMAMENALEDVAQSAVEKTIDDMMDQFKGEKGEKGDKGEDGKDGKDGQSFQVVGSYSTLSQFRLMYPLVKANVGKGALIGEEGGVNPRELWVITESYIGTIQVENMGDIRGVQGEAGKDADWVIQLRDEHNVASGEPIIVEAVAEGVPNLYIQGKQGAVVENFQGSTTGFTVKVKNPVPNIYPASSGLSTVDKFLTNNGTSLEWVDISTETTSSEAIRLKAPNGTIFVLSVDNHGRLDVTQEI